jgi:hypothetical protein
LKQPASAIIDTGTSQIALPSIPFKKLMKNWTKLTKDIKCGEIDVFCHANMSCDKLQKKLEPIGFQLSDYIFWIPPSEYLFPAGDDKCVFKVH